MEGTPSIYAVSFLIRATFLTACIYYCSATSHIPSLYFYFKSCDYNLS